MTDDPAALGAFGLTFLADEIALGDRPIMHPGYILEGDQLILIRAILRHTPQAQREKVVAELVDWTDQATQAANADDFETLETAIETRTLIARTAVTADDTATTPLVRELHHSTARAHLHLATAPPIDEADMDHNTRFIPKQEAGASAPETSHLPSITRRFQ